MIAVELRIVSPPQTFYFENDKSFKNMTIRQIDL